MQALRRSGRLFHQGRILLRHAIHLDDRQVDLFDAGALLLAGTGDLAHDVGDAAHAVDHFTHRHASLADQSRAPFGFLGRIVDEDLDFFRGASGALGQVAHFRRHHGKAAALLAGTCRFHGRVQRQDVGLEGDAVDDANDVDNFLRRFIDRAHGVNHLRHHGAALQGHVRGGGGQLVGFTRIVRILFHGRGQLFHGRCRFFQCAGLHFGARGQVDNAVGDFMRGRADGFRTDPHLADDADQAVAHFLHFRQQAGIVRALRMDADRQIALGDAAGNRGRVVGFAAELLEQAAGNHQCRRHAHRHGQYAEDDHEQARAVERLAGIRLHLLVQLVFQGGQLLQRIDPFFLYRADFLDHHARGAFRIVGHPQCRRLGDGRHGCRLVLLDRSEQGFFFGSRLDGEFLFELFLRFLIGAGLRLDTRHFRLHIARVSHQGEDAQRGDAVADVATHVDHQAGDDIVDIDHVIETFLDLRHARDAEDGHGHQQNQYQGESQAQAGTNLHFC